MAGANQDEELVKGHANKLSGGEESGASNDKPKAKKSVSEAYADATNKKPKVTPKKPKVNPKTSPVTRMPATNMPDATEMPATNMPDGSKDGGVKKMPAIGTGGSRPVPKNKPDVKKTPPKGYGAAIKGVIQKGKDILGIKSPQAPKNYKLKPNEDYAPYRSEGKGSSNFTKGELVGGRGGKKLYDYSDDAKKGTADAKRKTANNYAEGKGGLGNSGYTPGNVRSNNPGFSSDSTTSGGKNDIPVGRYGSEKPPTPTTVPYTAAGTPGGNAAIAAIEKKNAEEKRQAEMNREARVMQDHYNKTGGRRANLYKRGSIQNDDPRTAAYRRQGAGQGTGMAPVRRTAQQKQDSYNKDPMRRFEGNRDLYQIQKDGKKTRADTAVAKDNAIKNLDDTRYKAYVDSVKNGMSPIEAYKKVSNKKQA